MERTYEAFREAVKDDLRESLKVWNLSEDDLEAYVAQSEDEIKSEFKHCLNPREGDGRAVDTRLKSGASTIAYSLQLSY